MHGHSPKYFDINNALLCLLMTGQRYDVLPCQLSDTPSTDPVWLRAVIIDDDMVFPSKYNTTLGVLYFTPDKPTELPTTTAGK